MSTQTFEMNIDGEIIRWEEKSHAQIFRNFWQFFVGKDLQKTIETIELTGIRTADSEYTVGKNGSKRKNLFIKDNYYVHMHLNPAAMQKVYEKFIKGWESIDKQSKDETFSGEQQEVFKELQTAAKKNLKSIYEKSPAVASVTANHNSYDSSLGVEPVVTKLPDETEPLRILFGHSANTNEPLYWYPTTTSKIMHTNTGIVGTMGTGKTQFTKSLIKQIHEGSLSNVNGTPIDILIFDYKGDYIKDDFVEATNATIYQPYHLPYNPLSLYRGKQPKPLLPLHTASTIKETISNAFNLGIKQQQLLNDLIVESYSQVGIHKADMSTWDLVPPTLNNVFERFMDREDVKEDSLYAALKQIYDFEIFSPTSEETQSLYDMIQGVTVINLAGYDQSVQNLIVGITLDTFYSQMSTKGHSTIQGDYRELTKMILVDEADNFLSQNFTSLKKVMKEGREYGVGVILSTQFLDHFATADNDYTQYILTWVIHRVPTIKKKEVQALFSPESQVEGGQIVNKIAQLQKHYSLVTSVTKNKYEIMEDMAFWKLLS
ncbi:ATP-binding protein [Priestia flexa]|nr:ATP-binding protein [Priestia flexa]